MKQLGTELTEDELASVVGGTTSRQHCRQAGRKWCDGHCVPPNQSC